MIVHLDKEQTRQMRRKLLADNSDIVFILFHDILKELHKKGETQLSAVEVFLSARQFASTLLSMNEATEGLEDEIDDLEEEADGENDAMIVSIVACAVIKAFAKAHAMSVYDDVVMAILVRWNDHPLFMPMLAGAARKEEGRFAENKRNDLLGYELEQAAGEGEEAVSEAVRSFVDIAQNIGPDATMQLLLVLSRFNDNNGHKYQKEVDELYEIHKRTRSVIDMEVKGSGLSSLNFNNHVRQVVAHADVVEKYK